MKIEYHEHYSAAYWQGQKTYRGTDGYNQNYHGPGLAWDGFQYVADALAPLVPGASLLDIGCGGGDLAARFRVKGYDAYGVDVSEYALTHAVPAMVGRLALLDITTCPRTMPRPLPETYDVVLATDLLEHLYEEDLHDTFRWIVGRSKKWIFFCVATAESPDKGEFVLRKGETVPLEYEGTAVSGHVNVRHWQYWASGFHRAGLRIRWDLMYRFQLAREMVPAWRETMGWNMQTTWLLEKT